jgi:hypothetical protein
MVLGYILFDFVRFWAILGYILGDFSPAHLAALMLSSICSVLT